MGMDVVARRRLHLKIPGILPEVDGIKASRFEGMTVRVVGEEIVDCMGQFRRGGLEHLPEIDGRLEGVTDQEPLVGAHTKTSECQGGCSPTAKGIDDGAKRLWVGAEEPELIGDLALPPKIVEGAMIGDGERSGCPGEDACVTQRLINH
ncbi:hypothetical protein H261_00530 [Paramagnetospirillum caucaseum]|uniref:Uncharacterized protein n=1 Tax=Paramagnetospirillum caucaseum TaxID=1244869 RepID=M3AHI7_9PROT|nr:hypothetical protein H261_00530 [Paramagnetospirillum caucaseum]